MAKQWLCLGLLFGIASTFSSILLAQPLRVSPDTTMVLDGTTVDDEAVLEEDLAGVVVLPNIGTLPVGVDLTAYHRLSNGDQLLAFDTTVVVGGVTVEPSDVVRFDGVNYALELDASGVGVPAGTYVDAVAHDGLHLVLSFDTAVSFAGVFFDDADLVRYNGVGFVPLFDSKAAGVADGLDLDAARIRPDGMLQLSFDTSGILDGIYFDDEDILGFNPMTSAWSLAYDGSAQHMAWAASDLDALSKGELLAIPTLDGRGLLILLALLAGAGFYAITRNVSWGGEERS